MSESMSMISSASFAVSEAETDNQAAKSRKRCFCLTNGRLIQNKQLLEAIKGLNFDYQCVTSAEDFKEMLEHKERNYFICDDFKDEPFLTLYRRKCRVFGAPAVIEFYKQSLTIPASSRPLSNGSMLGVITCFTGFREKDELSHLCSDTHHMGGSVRREYSGKVNYLIANTAQGQKYKAAVSLGTNIMTKDWINKAWEKRDCPNFKATDVDFIEEHKMMPFHGLQLSFLGFPPDEQLHMEETTKQNGGEFLPVGDARCTHLVVEENLVEQIPTEGSFEEVSIVRQEWFWASIQIDACAEESLYLYLNSALSPGHGGSGHRTKKRKRLRGGDVNAALSPDSPFYKNKRPSKDLSTLSNGTFDSSLGSPYDISKDGDILEEKDIFSTPPKPLTARQQIVLELQQTERNYVNILSTIIKIFKEPIEMDQRGGPLLAPEEIKTIFSSIPDILDTHKKLLGDLDVILANWSEEKLVGKLIVDNAESMIKSYPHFVNYFDMTKETLVRLDGERPRFHAFLKICMTKPECGRQTLSELLIRPVQRIPSMGLLINDILKHTNISNPDHEYLTKAASSIKHVLTYINEDRRKTEGQVQMFEILREVEGCPAYILSSHRTLITKADMCELSDGLSGKGDQITMFLFNDSIETTRRKHIKNSGSMPLKSPATGGSKTPQRCYKHIEFILLSHIKTVVEIKDIDEYHNLFGLIYRSPMDSHEKLLIFRLTDDTKKEEWIMLIAKGLADTKCMTDAENFLTSVEPHELKIKKSDITDSGSGSKGNSLSRVLKRGKHTFTKKVGRAFSLNKTPKRTTVVRRAFSNLTPNTTRDNQNVSPTPSEMSMISMMDFETSIYEK